MSACVATMHFAHPAGKCNPKSCCLCYICMHTACTTNPVRLLVGSLHRRALDRISSHKPSKMCMHTGQAHVLQLLLQIRDKQCPMGTRKPLSRILGLFCSGALEVGTAADFASRRYFRGFDQLVLEEPVTTASPVSHACRSMQICWSIVTT